MRKTLLPLILLLPLMSGSATDDTVDWDKIRHWAGTGDNKAALVVQFDNNPRCYVWGYRWNAGENPTGEQMLRSIATASSDLDVLIQYTGWMGATVNGVGYSRDHSVLPTLSYDFDGASADGNISFGFFTPNTGMGQTSAPGAEAQVLADEAMAKAAATHVIEHPLNARDYGYAAYDYDYWLSSAAGDDTSILWRAGWYKGYWSYWTGTADISSLGYSALGMSSVEVADGDVHGWVYMSLDGDADASSGATAVWGSLDYDHFLDPASVTGIVAPDADFPATVYNGSGMLVGVLDREQLKNLQPGFYIIRQGDATHKVLVK